MNYIINRSTSILELTQITKKLYPSAIVLIDGPWVILDINGTTKYTIWLKANNKLEVIPQKAIWNRTFEMKAKAQEIALQLKEFLEKGVFIQNETNETPSTCPTCKNPNSNKLNICEWCGNQIT